MATFRLFRPTEVQLPEWSRRLEQAPPPVRSSAPQLRIDPARAGSDLATGTKIPDSRRTDLRGAFRAGAGIGVTAAGLGLGIGLAEGVPRAFGGQGPFGDVLNPDAKKTADNGSGSPIGAGINVLAWGALALGAIFLLSKGAA